MGLKRILTSSGLIVYSAFLPATIVLAAALILAIFVQCSNPLDEGTFNGGPGSGGGPVTRTG